MDKEQLEMSIEELSRQFYMIQFLQVREVFNPLKDSPFPHLDKMLNSGERPELREAFDEISKIIDYDELAKVKNEDAQDISRRMQEISIELIDDHYHLEPSEIRGRVIDIFIPHKKPYLVHAELTMEDRIMAVGILEVGYQSDAHIYNMSSGIEVGLAINASLANFYKGATFSDMKPSEIIYNNHYRLNCQDQISKILLNRFLQT